MPNTPLEDMSHVETVSNRADVGAAALKRERRRPRCDPQPRHVGENARDLLGHAFGEEGLISRRAHVGERQDGDRPGRSHDETVRTLFGPIGPIRGERTHTQRDDPDQHQDLGDADRLLTLFSVIPGQDQDDQKAGHQDHEQLPVHGIRPPQPPSHHIGHLEEHPGGGQIGQRPLDELALLETIDEG
jgi:hypothetical protein